MTKQKATIPMPTIMITDRHQPVGKQNNQSEPKRSEQSTRTVPKFGFISPFFQPPHADRRDNEEIARSPSTRTRTHREETDSSISEGHGTPPQTLMTSTEATRTDVL